MVADTAAAQIKLSIAGISKSVGLLLYLHRFRHFQQQNVTKL